VNVACDVRADTSSQSKTCLCVAVHAQNVVAINAAFMVPHWLRPEGECTNDGLIEGKLLAEMHFAVDISRLTKRFKGCTANLTRPALALSPIVADNGTWQFGSAKVIETSSNITDEEHFRKGGRARLSWQLCGIAAILVGSYFLDGWPASLIAFGLWAILATTLDVLNERLMLIWQALQGSRFR
jgi:hypothetical protein